MNGTVREMETSASYLLSINEAAKYFGIGRDRLRAFTKENPDFCVTVGNRSLIKRRKFEEFLDKATVL